MTTEWIKQVMTSLKDHKIGTREEWLAARLELLKAEKALTRRSDELAQLRQNLPWVRIDKDTVSRPTRAWRLSQICSEAACSSSSITSCSAPSTQAAARHALRSPTALMASPYTLSTTT